jgi:hypothetical protein
VIAEQVAIQERRIEEQAQTKVEASQRFPVRLNGMVLFNAFLNGPFHGGDDYPAQAVEARALRRNGATIRQSIPLQAGRSLWFRPAC